MILKKSNEWIYRKVQKCWFWAQKYQIYIIFVTVKMFLTKRPCYLSDYWTLALCKKKYIIVMNQFWENGFTNSLSKIPVLISFMSFYGDFPKFSCKLCNKSSIKMQNIVQFSDVFRAFGRPVSRFGCPNSVAKKQFSSFLFLVVFLQKILWSSFQWFKNASNYFEIA